MTLLETRATFTLLPIDSLMVLKDLHNPTKFGARTDAECKAYLLAHGTPLPSYQGSGSVIATLLVYLQEKKEVNLLKSDFDDLALVFTQALKGIHYVLTFSHKTDYEAKLDPSAFAEKDVASYYESFTQTQSEASGKALLEGIAVLRANLLQVTPESLILLSIG